MPAINKSAVGGEGTSESCDGLLDEAREHSGSA